MSAAPRYRIGYCTSGLAHHRLDEALRLISDLGYRGVFLTPDAPHLDPYSEGLPARVEKTAKLLHQLDLAVVVECGARYLLDPRRKHQPTLLSTVGRERRVDFLSRSLAIARDLGAKVLSFWSGTNVEQIPSEIVTSRLDHGVQDLLGLATSMNLVLGLEPEPGMLIETLADFHALRRRLGSPERLRLSLDCGHLLVTGECSPESALVRERDLLAAVAIEDMQRARHEHLPFGAGDVDLPALVNGLAESGFDGVVAVELGRHSHEGPMQALAARHALEPLGVPFGALRP